MALAALFIVVSVLRPNLLRPLNHLWFRFGMVLHRVVNPLILGLLFFLTITPLAFIMRIFGKDPLRLAIDPEATSYWIVRHPPGPPGDAMRRQF